MGRRRTAVQGGSGLRPYIEILKLVWPLALGMINNAVMQIVDRAYLAHESMESLEAALPASMLALIVLGFFQSVVAYSGVFVAQFRGAGDMRGCRAAYRAATLLALVSGAVALAAVPLGDAVFDAFSSGADVIARQKSYYGICIAGGTFLFGQMAAQSYFTGLGDTRTVFWVNVAGNVVNVAVDPILIFGLCGFPALGIAGAAYATVFATAVQWIVLAMAARRREAKTEAAPMRTRWRELPPLMLRVLRFGVPSGAYSVLNILSFTVFVFIAGRVGHLEAAVSNACFAVNYLLIAPMEGFAIGAATLVGQAQGRGDHEGAATAGFRCVALGVAVVAVLSLAAVALHRPILSVFAAKAGADAEAFHSLGLTLFLLMAAWQMFDAADVVVSGALKGAGDTRFVMWWMMLVAFGFWLPLVWIVSRLHNTMPALWGTMIAYVAVMCAGSLVRWRRGSWRRIRILE